MESEGDNHFVNMIWVVVLFVVCRVVDVSIFNKSIKHTIVGYT